jgi:hypothetical protein
MKRAGFDHVEFAGATGIITSGFTEGALFRAMKSV